MTACGRGICAANEGHEGTCAEASGWPVTNLSPFAAEVDRLARDMADVFMGRPISSRYHDPDCGVYFECTHAPCPACGHIPRSWRQPRVPRSVTQRGQERPGTESADESPDGREGAA